MSAGLPGAPTRRDRLCAIVELLAGLGMLVGFLLVLFVPALSRLATELPWIVGGLQVPTLGINPHHVAGARQVPSLLVLVACAALLVCYRWLSSRRRN